LGVEMKIVENNPPRIFEVGIGKKIILKDCGKISLEPDEMVTFVTKEGHGYDLTRKSWGFYATPSMNGRLKREGFKSALVRNAKGLYFLLLVESDKIDPFLEYLKIEQTKLIEWLDEKESTE
jgi:hypothetical protein